MLVTTSNKTYSLRASPGGNKHLFFIKWALQDMPTLMICTFPSFLGGSLETVPGAPCSSGPTAGNKHISSASLLPSPCSSDFVNLVPKASPALETHFFSTSETQVSSTEISL